MSEWLEQREAFYKIAIARGMGKVSEIAEAFPFGQSVLPPGKMEKWLERFVRVPRGFSAQRRYVNRFRIGADPEFTFINGTNGGRKDAQSLKLKQGPAFGADNNGRLAEIRPYPSRSALEVCASVLTTLRWMSIIHPTTLNYEWHAGAWSIEDGLGGHVHFGRKRPDRAKEVRALDTISETLLDLGLFNRDQQARRRAGDSHRQLYGQVGDFRLQNHGYEYRTFPSWLDSPELAFLTMTLAKFAVHDPNILWKYTPGPENMLRIVNLLRFYKDSDDDARLGLLMIERGLKMDSGGDFRAGWGIESLGIIGVKVTVPSIVPLSIKPSKEDIEEMFDHFFKGTPLKMRAPEPTWGPIAPPRGYRMVIDSSPTIQRKGIGELCWDICCSENGPLFLHRDNVPGLSMRRPVAIDKNLARFLPKNDFVTHNHDSSVVYIFPQALDHGRSADIRGRLLSGILPLWKVKDVREDSYQQWRTNVKVTPKPHRWVGEWLRQDGKLPGI